MACAIGPIEYFNARPDHCVATHPMFRRNMKLFQNKDTEAPVSAGFDMRIIIHVIPLRFLTRIAAIKD
jgi:hypothetical protein